MCNGLIVNIRFDQNHLAARGDATLTPHTGAVSSVRPDPAGSRKIRVIALKGVARRREGGREMVRGAGGREEGKR